MFKSHKILGIIPARGGSKGILKKNIFPVKNLPLIAYTIREALDSNFIDRLIVSTDDEEIAEISKLYGADVPFKRPLEFSTNEASSESVIFHTLNWVKQYDLNEYTYFVLLQPTSPLRTTEHIDAAIEKLILNLQCNALISITPVSEHPILMKIISKNDTLQSYIGAPKENIRRQDLPMIYYPNGAIYMSNVKAFYNFQSFNTPDTTYLLMEKKYSIDIDDLLDVTIVEHLLP